MSNEPDFNIKKIKFTNRPKSIPYFYRLTYRMSITCLIIKLSSRPNSACSLKKIQILTNALYSDEAFTFLQKALINKDYDNITIRYDPTVNTTIKFLLAENLIALKSKTTNKYILTELGEKFVDRILSNRLILNGEKEILNTISHKLNDTIINKLYKK